MTNVLVVDDTAIDRHLVQGILTKDADIEVESVESGALAIERLSSGETDFDVVVTDLTMPDMDGLQLVTTMCVQFPHIPVVLITAHGSEELAVRALEQGAASYVPKLQMADKLLDTVHQVTAFARSESSYERLTRCMTDVEFHFALENDSTLAEGLVELAQQIAGSMELCTGGERTRLGLALEEALGIAIYRGNLELSPEQFREFELHHREALELVEQRRMSAPYRDRRIHVDVRLRPSEARIVIRDEGGEPHFVGASGNGDPGSMMQEIGSRGLVMMNSLMDEVSFNEAGNEVTMVKRRSGAAAVE